MLTFKYKNLTRNAKKEYMWEEQPGLEKVKSSGHKSSDFGITED